MFNLDQLKALADKYQINSFYLFGSFADSNFKDQSDIDSVDGKAQYPGISFAVYLSI